MTHLPTVKRFVSSSGIDVFRIPCDLFPELSGRVHLIVGAGPVTLVDTGSGQGRSTGQILAGLEAIRAEFNVPVRLTDIQRILITHGHVDHIGGLTELVGMTGAEVGVHPLDRAPIVASEEHIRLGNRELFHYFRLAGVPQELHAGMVQAFGLEIGQVRDVQTTLSLDDGRSLDGLRFLHTPGHSPGHTCIQVGDILLSADHVLPVTIPQQWPERTAPYTGLGHYLDSLDKVAGVPGIRVALGGHEAPVEDVYRRIEWIRKTHQRRNGRLLDLVVGGGAPPTVFDLACRMYADAEGMHRVLALMDAGSRVEYLHQRGQLRLANLDEVTGEEDAPWRYAPA